MSGKSISNLPCDDPQCFCHLRPPKPFPKIEAVLSGPEPDQVRELHQPNAQLDVAFDVVGNTMTLNECVFDPSRPKIAYSVGLIIKAANVHFLNLEGLPDHSLLLSLRIRRAACAVRGNKMVLKEKFNGYFPDPPYSRLFNDLFECRWPEKTLQICLPEERCRRWKTVALILKTFKQITPDSYCHMANMMFTPRVGGLNVRQVKKDIKAQLAQANHERRKNPVSSEYMVTVNDEEKIERINHAYEVHLLAFIYSSSPFTPPQYL
ncbi:hypothetical protein BO78DRAFT_411781 [Aspergillus sclerotiicarbonarius CBS 121057]|uniref:Uncharacterized protein n=1 Tax=Aspergillus sclerotiicarbonarius (strain CBS 121057 / IBT 28362) TaxID=1448318 RepID=A0A319DTG9_ASPSB|nr:hypothetical protein BO78DRAFT_411781 [Aspergillus sclerotiicarbonarius CBS 121057]